MRRRHLEASAQGIHQRQAGGFMSMMLGPGAARRQAFADIVREHGEAHRGGAVQRGGPLQAQQNVFAGVDLRMPLRRLRHTKQAIDFRKDHGQRAAIPQHTQVYVGPILAQGAFGFLPHPLGDQRTGFARIDHPPHQGHRVVMHGEAQRCKARRKARHAQDAHRILDEGLRHMAQHARSEIRPAPIGIDQRSVRRLRDRIEGEVAAAEVFLQRDVGRESRPTGV